MDAINALIDIVKTFKPLEDEACVALNSNHESAHIKAIRESIEPWKFFEANETGDSSRIVNSFGYGRLLQPIPELQGDFVLWNPKVIRDFNKVLPLASKKITFDDGCRTWFASFIDAEARADAYLGSGKHTIDADIPRFSHFFPKLSIKVNHSAAKQFKAMLKQEASAGIDDFWLFRTKNNRICASFDRQPKSDSTKRIVLGTGLVINDIIPYTFSSKRFSDMLDLMENGSIVQVELLTDSCLRVTVDTKYGNYAFVLFGDTVLIRHWELQHLIPEATAFDRRGYGEPCMFGDWDPEKAPPR